MSSGTAWPRRGRATHDRWALIRDGEAWLRANDYAMQLVTENDAYGVGYSSAFWQMGNLTSSELRQEIEVSAASPGGEVWAMRSPKEVSARLAQHAQERTAFLDEVVERQSPHLAKERAQRRNHRSDDAEQIEQESEVNLPSSPTRAGFPQDRPRPRRSRLLGGRRDKTLDGVRVSQEERAALKDVADSKGMTLSDYVRQTLNDQVAYDRALTTHSEWEKLKNVRTEQTGDTE